MVGKKNDEVAQKNCRGKLNLIIHNSFSIRAGRRFFCLLILPKKKTKQEFRLLRVYFSEFCYVKLNGANLGRFRVA